MMIFYSGSAGHKGDERNEPEHVLKDEANIMLSYWLITARQQEQHWRFPSILTARQQRKEVQTDESNQS